MSNERYITPPELAKQWGVASDKVLHLIHTGQLRAVNLACNAKGRPRWRIAVTEVERFEATRSNKPPVPRQRRRRTAATSGREFF